MYFLVLAQSRQQPAVAFDPARKLCLYQSSSSFGQLEKYDASVTFEPLALHQSELGQSIGMFGSGGATEHGDSGDLAGTEWAITTCQCAHHVEFGARDAAGSQGAIKLVQGLRTDSGDPSHHLDRRGVDVRVGAIPFTTDFVDEVVFGTVGLIHGTHLSD